jgi:VCBS repeat-containing protein
MYNIKAIRRLSPLGFLSLVACGGGNTPSNLNISGTVQKGPLENALVFLDYDGDWQLGSTEPSIRTDSGGNFTLTPTESVYSIVAITDGTTVDNSSGSVLSGVTFKAPSGSLLINPTTTLMIESELTVEKIVAVLGLPTGFDPSSFDAFNPNLANSDKLVALAYEKTNHQLMNAVKSFAAAAEGAGAGPEKSFSMALASVVDVIKDKAALLENPNASITDKTINFTLQSDLVLIQNKAVEKVELITGIEASALAAFTEIVDNITAAIRNVNILIGEITNADLLTSATVNTFGTSQVLVSQVKAAVLAEALVAGTGSILYETVSNVIDAAQNGAPTGITLSNNSMAESVSSLLVGTVATLDLDQDINTAHSYKIVEAEGTDYASFIIDESSGELSFVRQPDFETQSSYTVTVSTTDAGGKVFVDTFTISVIDDEENSVINGVSNGNLTEDAGALLELSGALTVTDEDAVAEPFFVAQERTEGSAELGFFQINTEGVWAYIAYNSRSAIQALGNGETVEDTFTVSANDGTTQVVTVTISGQNDVAVIDGNTTGNVLEDAGSLLNASGALTISDLDNGQEIFIAQTDTPGASGLGTFNLTVNGAWSYTADNTQAVIQALGEGDSVEDTFTTVSADGTTQVVTITITGVTDITVIGGISTGAVTEDTVSGESYKIDVTTTDTAYTADTLHSMKLYKEASDGTLTDAGVIAGATGTAATDGTAGSFTANVTITAAAEIAKVGVYNPALDTSTTPVAAELLAHIVIAPTTSYIITNNSGDSYTITVTTTDTTYTAETLHSIKLYKEASDGTLTDAGVIAGATGKAATDGTAGSFTANATITAAAGITKVGVYNPALDTSTTPVAAELLAHIVIAPTTSYIITNNNFLTASGALMIENADAGNMPVFVEQTNINGSAGLGTFNLTVDGAWSYTADNTQAAIQALGNGIVVTDTLTALSTDGITQVITIAITGVNDILVIGGVSTGQATEDTGAFLNVSGALTIADTDANDVPVFVVQTNTNGSAGLGTFNLTADGAWSYTADNTQAAIQALDTGITTTDTFTAMSADGTPQVVTVTIMGLDDYPKLSAIELNSNAGGFAINGASQTDQSGRSVSNAGDVNGDGFDDLIIGAHRADPNGLNNSFDSGASYVVFGKESGDVVELSDIEIGRGTFGFMIAGGIEKSYYNQSVSGAGDVNGDGLADLIVGAPLGGAGRTGISFVVFGKADNTTINLSDISLNNIGGFVINGVSSLDQSGQSVSGAGDVNGDGKDDLIVGSFKDDPNGSNSGASFVVFGKADTTAVALSDIEGEVLNPIDLDGNAILDDPSGFVINGVAEGDLSGTSVSGAGDVNGDGLDDLIIGASHDDPNGSNSGAGFVVFGKAGSEVVELSAIGTGGFAINGISAGDATGSSVSGAGDVNGDGLDDVIIGAPFSGSDRALSGASFVVFGKAGTDVVELSDIKSGTLNLIDLNLNGLLDDPSGFEISGLTSDALLGHSVSDAGDVNGDGFDDLIIGAHNFDFNGSSSGTSFVVFGKADGTAVDIPGIITGRGGFALNGVSQNDQSGRSVSSAGDVNGDGFDDLLIGAPLDDPNSIESAGTSFVFFGGDLTGSVALVGTTGADTLSGTIEDEIIYAGGGNDTISASPGIDRLSGGNGTDIFIFSPDDGTTTIIDFSRSEGDQIDVSAFGFPNPVTIIDAITRSGGNESKLTLDPNTFIYFEDIIFSSFTAADFII